MTTPTSHPPFEQLLDYVEGKLAPAQQKGVQQHLDAGCPTCRANLVWVNQTFTLLSPNEWRQPPAALQTAARQAFRSQAPRLPRTRPVATPAAPRHFRPRSHFLFSGYAVLLVFLLSGLLFILEPAFVPARANTSVALKGNVEVQPQGEDEWQPASDAYNPRSGDLLRTKNASTATLSFFGRTVTRLDANTAVAVTALRNSVESGDATVILHQWEGQTENSVGLESYNESQLIIQTPAVIITGETATFMTSVDRNGDTMIFVRQGQVKVTAEGVTTTIMAGQAARILVGTAPITIALNSTPTPSPSPSSAVTTSPVAPPEGTPMPPAEDATLIPTVPPTYTPAAPNNTAPQSPPASQDSNNQSGPESTPASQGYNGSPPGQDHNNPAAQPPGQNRP
jgi:hypothetical protein